MGFLPADRDTSVKGLLGVWAAAPVLAIFREVLFNPKVWSDYSAESPGRGAKLTYHELKPGERYAISGMGVEPVPLNHAPDALGFIVHCADTLAVFAIDSGPTDLIWERAQAGGPVSAMFCDVSFPNRLSDLAAASAHLTPQLLVAEVEKVTPARPRVFGCHLKPQYDEEVRRELRELPFTVEVPVSGEVVEL